MSRCCFRGRRGERHKFWIDCDVLLTRKVSLCFSITRYDVQMKATEETWKKIVELVYQFEGEQAEMAMEELREQRCKGAEAHLLASMKEVKVRQLSVVLAGLAKSRS